jgi:hypothetical protein
MHLISEISSITIMSDCGIDEMMYRHDEREREMPRNSVAPPSNMAFTPTSVIRKMTADSPKPIVPHGGNMAMNVIGQPSQPNNSAQGDFSFLVSQLTGQPPPRTGNIPPHLNPHLAGERVVICTKLSSGFNSNMDNILEINLYYAWIYSSVSTYSSPWSDGPPGAWSSSNDGANGFPSDHDESSPPASGYASKLVSLQSPTSSF